MSIASTAPSSSCLGNPAAVEFCDLWNAASQPGAHLVYLFPPPQLSVEDRVHVVVRREFCRLGNDQTQSHAGGGCLPR